MGDAIYGRQESCDRAGTATREIARFVRHIWVALAAALLVSSGFVANAQQRSQEQLRAELSSLAWQTYPAVGVIRNEAQIQLPTIFAS